MRRHVTTTAAVLIGLFSFSAPVSARQLHSMIGTWDLDMSKFTRAQPPKAVSIVLSAADAGKFKMSVDIVDSDGKKSHSEGVFKPDGVPSPAIGSTDVDVVSMTMPNKKVLVMGAGYKGHPSNTRVFTISEDGKHMSETVVGHGADGTPNTQINTWNRR
jgi:hypothetical protein